MQFSVSQAFGGERHNFLRLRGLCVLLAAPRPVPYESLDAVSDQRGLVGDLPGARSAAAGQHQQQQQHHEDHRAHRHQGVGDDPEEGLLLRPHGAVRRHVCC